MGGWSINGNWSAADYNLTKDVIFSKVKFISGALFSWRVSEDYKNSSSHVLLVNIFTFQILLHVYILLMWFDFCLIATLFQHDELIWGHISQQKEESFLPETKQVQCEICNPYYEYKYICIISQNMQNLCFLQRSLYSYFILTVHDVCSWFSVTSNVTSFLNWTAIFIWEFICLFLLLKHIITSNLLY